MKICLLDESTKLIDLVIGDVPGGVGVPMVFQFRADIQKWNAKVPPLCGFCFHLC